MEFIVLAFFCGLSAAVIGKLKGSSFWIWFLVGAVLPLLGTIVAIFYRSEHASRGAPAPSAGRCAAPRAGLHPLRARPDWPDEVIPAR